MANSIFIRRSERLDRKYLAAALSAYKVYHYASTRSGLPHSQVMQLLGKSLYFQARCSQEAKLEYQAMPSASTTTSCGSMVSRGRSYSV